MPQPGWQCVTRRSRVISGLSLPLALELVDNQHTLSADDLCQHLQAIASQCCVVWQQPETVEEEF
ncbi:sorbose-specific phosphotransferase enzyme IIA component [Klebsiella pneumoniae subsp. ozaenae]|uniref:Sorbose-specific phosphotransferase enzyme IIA component n=1 Tax=Klebsiella pneumoniae subsp. ozaenae TaxID=574 RepID=A0A378AVP2_KLEPO|nr:sorbose-specific phosphotransferase enzyme IIA component [Klebsiella pneumoniae subsp. ozaenae]